MWMHSAASRRTGSSFSRVNCIIESTTVANRPVADFDDTVQRTKLQLQLLQTMKSNPRSSWAELFAQVYLKTGASHTVYDSTASVLLLHNDIGTVNVGYSVSYLQIRNGINQAAPLRFPMPVKDVYDRRHFALFDIDPFVVDPNNTAEMIQDTAPMDISQQSVKVNKWMRLVCSIKNIPTNTKATEMLVPVDPLINVPTLYVKSTSVTLPVNTTLPTIDKHFTYSSLIITSEAPSSQLATKSLVVGYYTGAAIDGANTDVVSVRDAANTRFSPYFDTQSDVLQTSSIHSLWCVAFRGMGDGGYK